MKKIIAVAAITAIFIIGLMVGASEPTVLAQTTPPAETVVESDPDLEWEMFSGNIAGYGGAAAGTGTSNTFAFPQTTTVPGGTQVSTVFLYNRRTGKAYRYFSNCDTNGTNGCMAALGVIELSAATTSVPTS